MRLAKRHVLASWEENFVHLDLGANLVEMDFVVFIRAKMALLLLQKGERGTRKRERERERESSESVPFFFL